jgi:predicted RecB family endonuclease
LREIAVVARGEEEAQAGLLEVLGVEVVLHPDVLEIAGGRLHSRFAHLERRLRGRSVALLGDENRSLGAGLL